MFKHYRYNQVEDNSDRINRRIHNVCDSIGAIFGLIMGIAAFAAFMAIVMVFLLWLGLMTGVLA